MLCKYIINDLEISSEDSDEKDSNEEMPDKETSDEKVKFQNLSIEEKAKSDNMVMNDIKTFLNMKVGQVQKKLLQNKEKTSAIKIWL